eukprot:GABW01003203.1.p2 GENE.GABW01003203.1~~GABW01003203.1.p2  ORF type:complete len:90 (+),score=21.52 GABW01003203.1:101-370(+)
MDCIKTLNFESPRESVEAAKEYLCRALPVHRISGTLLSSVLNHGCLMSLVQMSRLGRPEEVIKAVEHMPILHTVTDDGLKSLGENLPSQ